MLCCIERFCLIYWTGENSVTSVPREKVIEGEIEVGGECKVKQGRKMYTGKIVAIGKHSVNYTVVSGSRPQQVSLA